MTIRKRLNDKSIGKAEGKAGLLRARAKNKRREKPHQYAVRIETTISGSEIEKSIIKVRNNCSTGVQLIIEIGKELNKTKKKVAYGLWATYFPGYQGDKPIPPLLYPFKQRAANMYMAVADHPILSNSQYFPKSPASIGTLDEIMKIPNAEILKMIGNKINSGVTQREVTEILDKINDDGFYKFERVHDAVATLLFYQEKWPHPNEEMLRAIPKGRGRNSALHRLAPNRSLVPVAKTSEASRREAGG